MEADLLKQVGKLSRSARNGLWFRFFSRRTPAGCRSGRGSPRSELEQVDREHRTERSPVTLKNDPVFARRLLAALGTRLDVTVPESDLIANDMDALSDPELRNSPLEASSQPCGADPDGEPRPVVGLHSDAAHCGFA